MKLTLAATLAVTLAACSSDRTFACFSNKTEVIRFEKCQLVYRDDDRLTVRCQEFGAEVYHFLAPEGPRRSSYRCSEI